MQSLKNFIFQKLKVELSNHLFYHTWEHTKDVITQANRIAKFEKIDDANTHLLLTAALLHDIGFVEKYDNNEEISAKYARKILPHFNYTKAQINTILNIILSTKISKQPKTILEKIICDADLDYLGRKDYFEIAERFRQELFAIGRKYTEINWIKYQISFLKKHKYNTNSQKELRNHTKQYNVEKLIAKKINLLTGGGSGI